MADLSKLKQAVADMTAAVQEASAEITTLVDRIKALPVPPDQQAEVDAITDGLESQAAALKAAAEAPEAPAPPQEPPAQ